MDKVNPRESVGLSRVAFWLVPSLGHRRQLQSLIDRLAGRFNTAPFLPHMTIWCCDRPRNADMSAFTAIVAGNIAPVSLRVMGHDGSDSLTRAFYLRLESSKALLEIVECVQKLTAAWPCSYRLDPHLSLLYHDLAETDRPYLMEEFSAGLTEIHFNELRTVAIPQRIMTVADLHGWLPLAVCQCESRSSSPDAVHLPGSRA